MNAFLGRRRTINAARTAASKEVTGEPHEEIKETREEGPVLKRGLCPKCKAKPNHFFHVKYCKG